MGDKTEGNGLSAPYDSQEEVYVAMFKELEEADKALKENLGLSAEGFKKLDNLYYGDVRKWYKYLHSLQLRIAMRIVYVKPELAREIAEKAVAAGVIENNEDNAQLHVEENRSALCFNDWKDYRIAAEIVSYMQGYNDPRLEKYFTQESIRMIPITMGYALLFFLQSDGRRVDTNLFQPFDDCQ